MITTLFHVSIERSLIRFNPFQRLIYFFILILENIACLLASPPEEEPVTYFYLCSAFTGIVL